jgi:hypothetical protein
MNLLKINEILTKAMLGIFVSVVAFCFFALAIPALAYAVAVLLYILLGITIVNSALSTWLIVQQMNKMIEEFFKQHEQAHS